MSEGADEFWNAVGSSELDGNSFRQKNQVNLASVDQQIGIKL